MYAHSAFYFVPFNGPAFAKFLFCTRAIWTYTATAHIRFPRQVVLRGTDRFSCVEVHGRFHGDFET